MAFDIKLSLPQCTGNEIDYITKALDGDWIVPLGPDVDRFEHLLSEYTGSPYAVALSAGTAALHLALILCGVRPGDEVLCQSLTFAASANPVLYCGAKPVFIDSERQTWNMNPDLLEQALEDRRKAGRLPRAVMVVDLYGMPAQLPLIADICRRYGVALVEDAAEALGSEIDGRKCGTFGAFGALSFNGNKIITTAGGGALLCHTGRADKRARFLSTQAREDRPYYYHHEAGYNYRMSNIGAAIGCAQIADLSERVARRRAIHDLYAELLSDLPWISVHGNPQPGINSNFWLTTILLTPDAPVDCDTLRRHLAADGIESRLLWRPMHMQPLYHDAECYGGEVSADLFGRGLCLPSGTNLTDEQIARVAQVIRNENEV